MKSLAVLFLLFLCFEQLNAQHSENIISDRPGMSSSSFTVGRNVWQVQSGFDYYRDKYWLGTTKVKQSGQVLNTLVRYGLLERFELGVGFNLRTDQFNFGGLTSGKYGINGLGTHLRANFLKEGKYKPNLALQFNLAFPYATGTYSGDLINPKLALHIDKTFLEKWTGTINTGFDAARNSTPGEFTVFTAFYTLSFTYAFSSSFSVFGEHYAFIKKGNIDYKFDGGFAYLLNSDFQLDLSCGYDENQGGDDSFFVSTGISWRFDKNWKTSSK